MAYIDNTQTKKEIEDAIRGNSVSNLAPSKVSDNVQLVCNVNPKDYRRCNIIKTATSATTIYTTPTDKDFYISGSMLSISTTAAGTNVASINIVPFGESVAIPINSARIFNTATVDGDHAEVYTPFSIPILLARGSTITSTSSGTIGSGRYTIIGYTVEP